MEKIFYVEGMMCSKCEDKVTGAVSCVDGVSSCKSNATKAQVTVSFDDSVADIEKSIKNAIADCGFKVLD
ncbi:MAG: heavy-metal-associated domain-containing protein [Treponemataceae bacterium]